MNQFFHPVFCHNAGMHGRSAADDVNTPRLSEDSVVNSFAAEIRPPFANAGSQCLFQRGRLFMNFLQHEMGITALLGRLDVPIGG